jgi:hypothetical protein
MLALSDRAAAGVWHQIQPTSNIRIDPIYEGTGRFIIRTYRID